MMGEFDGVKILITGGGNGFGLACATELISQGAKVAICDINEPQSAPSQSHSQFGPGLGD